jgi:hypothetical protein
MVSAMSRPAVAVLLALASPGCSYIRHDLGARSHALASARATAPTPPDCPGYAWPVLDTIGAGGFGFFAGEAYAHRNDADSAAGIFVIPIALVSAIYVTSAIYGYIVPGRCGGQP